MKIKDKLKRITEKYSKERSILKVIVICLLLLGLITKTYSWLYEEYVGSGVSINIGKISHIVTHYDASGNLIQDNEQTQTLIYETNLSNITKNTKYIKIENNGTLDLEYTLSLNYEGTVSTAGVLYYRLYEITNEVNNYSSLEDYAKDNPISDNIETDAANPIKNMTLINNETYKGEINLDPNSTKSAVYYRLDYGMYQTVNTSLYSDESISLHLNVYSTQIGATDETAIGGQIWQVSTEDQLREILISATNGDTIQLIDDIDVSGTINIGKRINLDTNDYTLKVTGDLVYDFANMGDLLIDVSGEGKIIVDNNLYINTPKAEVDIIGGNKTYDIIVSGTTSFDGIQDGEKDGIYLENLKMVKSSTTLVPSDVTIKSNTRLTIAPNTVLGVLTAEEGSTNIEIINNGDIIQLNFSKMSLLETFTKAQIYVYNLGNIYGIVGSTGIVLPANSTPYLGPNNGNTWIIKGITSSDITVSGSEHFDSSDVESNLDDIYVVPIDGEEDSYTVYIKDSLASVESLLVDYFTNEGYERPYEKIKDIKKLVVWTLNAQYFENEDFDFIKSEAIPYIEYLDLQNSRIIDGTTVNKVKDDALKDKLSLKTVILPKTVQIIGDNAFKNVSLGSMPNDKTSEFTFAIIPSSVTSIGENAYNASEYIYFESNTPPEIKSNTFNNDLAKIFVNDVDSYLDFENLNSAKIYQKGVLSDDRRYIVFEYNEGLGISYVINNIVSTTSIGIPSKITLNGSNKSVLIIGTNAYRHMNIYDENGVSVVLPSSVIRIDKYAFYNLNITSISLTNVLEVKDYAFYNTNIDMLTSQTLEIIGKHSFENTKIKELSLASIKEIESYAFNNVETMYSAYLYNVSTIGDYAFNDCKYLNKVYFTNTETLLINNAEEVNITLGTSSVFANWGFYTDGRLRVYVPDGTTESGNTYLSLYQKLFNGNENYIFVTGNEIGLYTHMALPYDINIYTVREVTIEDVNGWEIVSYQGKDLDSTYQIPETLTYDGVTKDVIAIGDYAYRNVLFEEDATIKIENNTLIRLGNYSLSNMDITSIKTPNVKEVGSYALYGTKLQTAEFDNLVTLNDYALAELLTLNMVNLGKVEKLGYSALYNDANLEQIFINNTDYTVVLGSNALYNVGVNASKRFRMYVPEGEKSLNYYKTLFVDYADYIYETGVIVGSYINAPIMYDIGEYSVREVTLKSRDGNDVTGYELIEYHGSDLSSIFELPDTISIEKSSVLVSTSLNNKWGENPNYSFDYYITLTNNSDEDISNWKVKVSTNGMQITNVYNVTREDYDNYTILSQANQWNSIPANGSINIQIQFTSSNADYSLNASYVDESTTGIPLISIGDRAFIHTSTASDTNIKFSSDNLINIGSYAFYNVKGVTELDLSNLTYIGDYAFYNGELTKVETPNLKSIGTYALSNMSTLYYINLGKVIEMKENSLYNLNNLLQVYFKPTEETIVFDTDAITNVGSLTDDRIRFYVDKIATTIEEETSENLNLTATSNRDSMTQSGGYQNRVYTYTMTTTIANANSKDVSSWSVKMNLGSATFGSVTSGANAEVSDSTVTFSSLGTNGTINAQGSVTFTYTVTSTSRNWSPSFETPVGVHISKELFETNIELVETYKNSFNEEYRDYFYTKGEIIGMFTPSNIPFEIGEYSVDYKSYKDTDGTYHNGWAIIEYHGADLTSDFTILEELSVNNVTMPLISIGEYAFRWAKMSDNSTIDIKSKNLLLIDDYALYDMTVRVINLENVDVIGDYAFYSNELYTVNAPNLRVLGSYALAENNVLNMVNLGKVESIGSYALLNDTALEQIFFTNTNADASTVTMNMTIGEGAFSNIATEIGKRFRIYVPDGEVTTSTEYKDAYKNTLPSALSDYVYETGILVNDYYYSVLPYNIYEFSVKEVTINGVTGYKIIEYHGPDITSSYQIPTSIEVNDVVRNVISIGEGAYVGVEVATNEVWDLVIPVTVLEIGDRAFYKTPISSLYSDATIESIGVEAFAECPNLTTVNLGTVKYILEKAFYLNPNLTTVRLGTGVLAIGSQAFYNTYNNNKLANFYIATESPPTIQSDTFPAAYSILGGLITFYNTNFYVPRQSVDIYKEATYWSARSGYINSSAELYDNTYYYSKNDDTLEVNIVEYIGNTRERLEIPDTFTINNQTYKVTSIDGGAFDSSSITTIVLPKYLTSIGDGFLDSNSTITDIEVDTDNTLFSSIDGVLYDGAGETLLRYPKAKSSSTYTLADDTKVLANGSFVNITLSTINFNSSLIAIGTGVFEGATSLTRMNFTSTNPPYLMGFGSFPTNYNLVITYPSGSESAYTNNLFYYSYRNYLREN